MFCPECRCEYIEGIKECVDCGVKLVDKLSEKTEIAEKVKMQEETDLQKDVLVEIRNYPGIGYGSIIKDFLVENGIPAILLSGGFYPTERIMVPERLADKADKLIMQFDEAAAEKKDESVSNNVDNENQDENRRRTILGHLRDEFKKRWR